MRWRCIGLDVQPEWHKFVVVSADNKNNDPPQAFLSLSEEDRVGCGDMWVLSGFRRSEDDPPAGLGSQPAWSRVKGGSDIVRVRVFPFLVPAVGHEHILAAGLQIGTTWATALPATRPLRVAYMFVGHDAASKPGTVQDVEMARYWLGMAFSEKA